MCWKFCPINFINATHTKLLHEIQSLNIEEDFFSFHNWVYCFICLYTHIQQFCSIASIQALEVNWVSKISPLNFCFFLHNFFFFENLFHSITNSHCKMEQKIISLSSKFISYRNASHELMKILILMETFYSILSWILN